ncbi:hypothetical protein MHZ36_04340 [Staphylococcus sp. ACRSN]|uniref:hypothetical protein n=1 Tax=Staphylococcus sp. ACRSN TaxID=2918214 RepID=UPI001EF2AF54|nr:hypothetical protein [Staphylococcus sp. ACRSN]MCG7338509.1 hypothetical protein [Staphylococcus sp. ACRSN]
MNKRFINGLKDGLLVFIGLILLAVILNYIGIDFGDNRIWHNLGDLGLINIFVNKELNGLIILGLILSVFSFAFGYAHPSKKK